MSKRFKEEAIDFTSQYFEEKNKRREQFNKKKKNNKDKYRKDRSKENRYY